MLEELHLSTVALVDLLFGLLDVLFLLQESGSERGHSFEKGVLGQSVVLEKTVKFDEAVALSAAENCLAQGHHLVDLLVLDAKIFKEVFFHT